jgi:phosphoserine phosphatase RsbU/P
VARPNGALKILMSRLSQRLVFVVFASIVTIETILLVPSVLRREKEFLSQIKEVSSGKVLAIANIQNPEISTESEAETLQQLSQLTGKTTPLIGKLRHEIIGGTLYNSQGDLIGTFGEKPQLSFSQLKSHPNLKKGDRYDVALLQDETDMADVLIIRHDVSSIKPELTAFVFRISGLVLIISAFTTVGVWIALDRIVVTPILRLRQDLLDAGDAIGHDRKPPNFYANCIQRRDEFGDVIAAFNQMFHQISEAIRDRKCAEAALQISFEKADTLSKALNKELDKGREIQANFLPDRILQKTGWEIAAFFQPARQVAGDFYDIFELPNGHVILVIADVCDKGVGAALFMALFRSMLRLFAMQTSQENGSNALDAVALTNNYVATNHGNLGMFATLFFGILDPATGILTYINGGHEPLYLLYSEGGIREMLPNTGPAVGILPQAKFKIAQTILQPGEWLLGYTDGVPEARSATGEFFSTKRFRSLVDTPANSAVSLLDRISQKVLEHTGTAEQFDDITLIAVRRSVKS